MLLQPAMVVREQSAATLMATGLNKFYPAAKEAGDTPAVVSKGLFEVLRELKRNPSPESYAVNCDRDVDAVVGRLTSDTLAAVEFFDKFARIEDVVRYLQADHMRSGVSHEIELMAIFFQRKKFSDLHELLKSIAPDRSPPMVCKFKAFIDDLLKPGR